MYQSDWLETYKLIKNINDTCPKVAYKTYTIREDLNISENIFLDFPKYIYICKSVEINKKVFYSKFLKKGDKELEKHYFLKQDDLMVAYKYHNKHTNNIESNYGFFRFNRYKSIWYIVGKSPTLFPDTCIHNNDEIVILSFDNYKNFNYTPTRKTYCYQFQMRKKHSYRILNRLTVNYESSKKFLKKYCNRYNNNDKDFIKKHPMGLAYLKDNCQWEENKDYVYNNGCIYKIYKTDFCQKSQIVNGCFYEEDEEEKEYYKKFVYDNPVYYDNNTDTVYLHLETSNMLSSGMFGTGDLCQSYIAFKYNHEYNLWIRVKQIATWRDSLWYDSEYDLIFLDIFSIKHKDKMANMFPQLPTDITNIISEFVIGS